MTDGQDDDEAARRVGDVQALLRLVERRTLTTDHFHSACALLLAGGDDGRLRELVAAVDEGRESPAALLDAVTEPERYAWTADRFLVWIERDEAHAAVNLRALGSMRIALTPQGLTAERFGDDLDVPVATLARSYDELLPVPE